MKRIAILLALCLSFGAWPQDTITLEDGAFISKLPYDWTSDGSGNATGRTTIVVPGILFGVATTPDVTNAPTDNYDIVVKQAFANTSGGVTVLVADLAAGAIANRDDTNTEWTDFWPNNILPTGGFIQIEISNAGAAKEGRVELYIYRTLAIIPEGGNGIPLGGVLTQILQNASNGTAKWVSMSGDGTLADGGALALSDPLLIEALTMTGILTTGSAPTTVTNADGTIKLSAIEAGGDIIGTTNQVNLTGSGVGQILGANLTLSLPQDVHTGASPTFAGITGTGILTMGSAPTTLTNADGTLKIAGLENISDILGTANQVTVSSGTGVLVGASDATLSLPNIVNLGTDDSVVGQVVLFGSGASVLGGILRIHNAADDDTDVEFWDLTTGGVSVGPFEIKDDGGTAIFSINDVSFDVLLSNELIVNGAGESLFSGNIALKAPGAVQLIFTRDDSTVTFNAPLGQQRFGGTDSDETDLVSALINVPADGAWTVGNTPSRIELFTTAAGSGTNVLNWTFESDGDLTLETKDLTLLAGDIEHTGNLFDIRAGNNLVIHLDEGSDAGVTTFKIQAEDDAVTLLTALGDTEEVVLFGGSGDGKAKTLSLFTKGATDDVTGATDVVALYAVDIAASAELHAIDEAGNATVLTPHNFTGIPGGPSEDMAWSYHSRRDGKTISVDMLRVIRKLEELTGEQFVFEGNVEEIHNDEN